MAAKQARLTPFGMAVHKILVGERSGKKYIKEISRILGIEIAA